AKDLAVDHVSDEKLSINISGRKFETWKNTLEKNFYDEDTGEYFFDRDPDIFRHILTFYRTGKLHPFSGIPDMNALSRTTRIFVCYEDYKDKNGEIKNAFFARAIRASMPDQFIDFQQKMWAAFENPHTSSVALVFYYVTGFFIAVSVLCNIIETIPCWYVNDTPTSCGDAYERQFFVLDTACVIIFTIEYLLRLYAAPDRCRFL
ncbi:K+ channel tetramerization domain protein, partial [Ostertagia ostertagi]